MAQFSTVEAVLEHWKRGGFGVDRVAWKLAEGKSAGKLSTDGQFIVRQVRGVWQTIHASTGLLVLEQKRETLLDGDSTTAFADALSTLTIEGRPFRWQDDGLAKRITAPNVRGALTELRLDSHIRHWIKSSKGIGAPRPRTFSNHAPFDNVAQLRLAWGFPEGGARTPQQQGRRRMAAMRNLQLHSSGALVLCKVGLWSIVTPIHATRVRGSGDGFDPMSSESKDHASALADELVRLTTSASGEPIDFDDPEAVKTWLSGTGLSAVELFAHIRADVDESMNLTSEWTVQRALTRSDLDRSALVAPDTYVDEVLAGTIFERETGGPVLITDNVNEGHGVYTLHFEDGSTQRFGRNAVLRIAKAPGTLRATEGSWKNSWELPPGSAIGFRTAAEDVTRATLKRLADGGELHVRAVIESTQIRNYEATARLIEVTVVDSSGAVLASNADWSKFDFRLPARVLDRRAGKRFDLLPQPGRAHDLSEGDLWIDGPHSRTVLQATSGADGLRHVVFVDARTGERRTTSLANRALIKRIPAECRTAEQRSDAKDLASKFPTDGGIATEGFLSVEAVYDHWKRNSGHGIVVISPVATQVLSEPEILGGTFLLAKHEGSFHVFDAQTGLRLTPAGGDRSVTDVRYYAQLLQALTINEAAFDWHSPGLLERLQTEDARAALHHVDQSVKIQARLTAADDATKSKRPARGLTPAAVALRRAWASSEQGATAVAASRTRTFAAEKDIFLSANGRLVVVGSARKWTVVAPSGKWLQLPDVISDTTTKTQALDLADALSSRVKDADGRLFDWEDDVVEAAKTWRSADGRTLDSVLLELRAEHDRANRLHTTIRTQFDRIRVMEQRTVLPINERYGDEIRPGDFVVGPKGRVSFVASTNDNEDGTFTVHAESGESQVIARNQIAQVTNGPGLLRASEGEVRPSDEVNPGDAIAFSSTGFDVDPCNDHGVFHLAAVEVRGVATASHLAGEDHVRLVDVTIVDRQGQAVCRGIDIDRDGVPMPETVTVLHKGARPDLRPLEAAFAELKPGDLWVDNGLERVVLSLEATGDMYRCDFIFPDGEDAGFEISDGDRPVRCVPAESRNPVHVQWAYRMAGVEASTPAATRSSSSTPDVARPPVSTTPTPPTSAPEPTYVNASSDTTWTLF